MNTEYFRYIVEIANCRSISEAADTLHLQRPYLSKVIRGLEEELEVTIFQRSPKGIIVTDAGAYVIGRMKEVLEIVEDLKNHGQEKRDAVYPQYYDEVTLLTPQKIRPYKGSAQYLPVFQKKFPKVVITIKDIEMDQIISAVRQQPMSVALVIRSELMTCYSQPIPPDMKYHRIGDIPIVALASSNNPLAKDYQSISLASLAKQELVFMDNIGKEGGLIWQLMSQFGRPKIRYSVGSLALWYQLLKNNSYFSLGLYNSGIDDGLLQIPLRDHLQVEVGLLYHEDTLKNFVGSQFVAILLGYYGRISASK